MNPQKKGLSTNAVHAGEDRIKEHGPLTTPIYQTSTFVFDKTQDLHDFFQGKTKRVAEYGRYGNPTQDIAQKKLASLENAESCLLFSSGMAAVTTAIFALCKSGDHIVITNDSYRRTRQFLHAVLAKYNVEFSFVDPNAEAIEKGIQDNTKLLISESPTNPYLRVLDLEAVVEVCKRKKVKSLIDSTFATPYNQRPIEFGIDLVVHSITKYLGGHNDIMGGALLGKDHLVSGIKEFLSILGGVIDANSSYYLIRGLKTFALRIERQNQSALKVAQFLEQHDKVDTVWYPGLESHPDHKIAKEQMHGFGGVISYQLKSDLAGGSRFVDALEIPFIAPSLGGVESLIEQPALMSFYELSEDQRNELGIYNNLIRMSIGIENVEDIILDLTQGLEKI